MKEVEQQLAATTAFWKCLRASCSSERTSTLSLPVSQLASLRFSAILTQSDNRFACTCQQLSFKDSLWL